MKIFGVSSYDPKTVNRRLEFAAANHNLISPATSCTFLPPGYELALLFVEMSPKPAARDAFLTEDGLYCLNAGALKRIGNAAGVSPLPLESGKLQGPEHPYFCRYRAAGTVRRFDSTWKTISGEVVIDLRDGSKQLRQMRERGTSEQKIARLRMHLIGFAETQAKARAMTELGFQRSGYTAEGLAKGFAVAQLVWTGRSRNATFRRIFAEETARAALNSRRLMYGKGAA